MNYSIQVTKTSRYCYINAILGGERIGKVCVDLDPDDAARYRKVCDGDVAKIVLVETSSRYCGKGIATALLNKTIGVLKDYSLYLNVVPLKRNSRDKDRNQLVSFYSKFGFGLYKDDICITTMIKK